MIDLLLVDDHAMLREGLRSKFADCDDVNIIGEAGDGKQLLALLKTAKPDVIIMDIKMPDTSGISLMQHVANIVPNCRVVILTMYDHVRYALHALESGAHGFVVKGSPFDELLQAVRDVHENKTYISSTMAPKLADRFRRRKDDMSLDSLSQREFEVFTLLGSGLSLKEAASQMGISDKTVTTYRARLMEKLDLSNKADLIRVALELGLVE